MLESTSVAKVQADALESQLKSVTSIRLCRAAAPGSCTRRTKVPRAALLHRARAVRAARAAPERACPSSGVKVGRHRETLPDARGEAERLQYNLPTNDFPEAALSEVTEVTPAVTPARGAARPRAEGAARARAARRARDKIEES